MPLDSPPASIAPPRAPGWRGKFLIALALLPACLFGAMFLLRICNLLRPFSVPTGAMTPAVSPGDDIMMEGVSFLFHQPRLGDIIVFKTDGIASLPSRETYLKRVAGRPGDHVRLAGGKLFVNEKQVSLSNAFGEITYDLPKGPGGRAPYTDLTVPADSYFVLGDNSTNSLDSRYWGTVPRKNIIGRIWFCYSPPPRAGKVK